MCMYMYMYIYIDTYMMYIFEYMNSSLFVLFLSTSPQPLPCQNQLQKWEVADPRAAKSAGGRDWLRRKRMHNAGVWASPGLRFYRKQRAWLANQKD